MGLFDSIKKKNEAKRLGLSIEQYDSFLDAQSAGLTLDEFKRYLSSFSAKYSIKQYVDYLTLEKRGLSKQQCERYFEEFASTVTLEDYPEFLEAEKMGLSASEYSTYSTTLNSKMSVADYIEFLRAQKLGFTLGKYLKYLKSFKGEMTLEEYDIYLQAETNGVDHEHYLEYLNQFMDKYTLERYIEFNKARSLGMTLEEYDLRSEAAKAGMALEDYKNHLKAIELGMSDEEYSCYLEVSQANWIADDILTIPKTLITLPKNVFKHFAFRSISFPETMVSIPDYSFEGCTGVETVVIPSSVNSIGDGAFKGCSKLHELTINAGVETIGDSAFEDCTSLTEVYIPGSVKEVGYHAFWGCDRLEKLEFETGVESVDVSDWADLPCLKEVLTPCTASINCRSPYRKGNQKYGVINAEHKLSFNAESKIDLISPADYYSYGIGENRAEIEFLEVNGDYVFLNLSGFYKLKTVVFSALGSITHIENCPELQMIVYRSYLAEIPTRAFMPAIKNTEQEILSRTLTAKEIIAPKLRFLAVEDGAMVVDLADYNGSKLAWLHIPSTTSRLSINTPSITSVAIHGNCKVKDESLSEATSIHTLRFDVDGRTDGVFSNAKTKRILSAKLQSCDLIDIQFDCPIFSSDLFGAQGEVRHISLPKNLKRIENNAFDSWGIEDLTIPSSVNSIGDEAFINCQNLSAVVFEGIPSDIGSSLFAGCESLNSVLIAGKELSVQAFVEEYEAKEKTTAVTAETDSSYQSEDDTPFDAALLEHESSVNSDESDFNSVGRVIINIGNHFSIELPENYKYSLDQSIIGPNRVMVAMLDDEKAEFGSPYSATESITILLGNDLSSLQEADNISKSIGIDDGIVIKDKNGLNVRYLIKEQSPSLSIFLALICTCKKSFPAQIFFNNSRCGNTELFVSSILGSIKAIGGEIEEAHNQNAKGSRTVSVMDRSTENGESRNATKVLPRANTPVSHVPDGVRFIPGEEPLAIRQRIDRLFEKLNQAYPDKVVVALHKDHKKWGETVTALYRELGYPDGNSFLTAYGYTVGLERGGRPAGDASAIIDELKRRYSEGPTCAKIIDLISENPDLASKFKNLQNQADKLFGMPFAKYLIQEGILLGNAEDNCGEVFEQLKQRYASSPFSGTVNDLRAANEDIDWKAINRFYAKAKTADTLKTFLVKQGIMTDRKATAEESLEAITQTLKKRYPAGSQLPHSIEQLKLENGDLSLFGLNSLTMQVHKESAKDYLTRQGILAKEKTAAEYLHEVMTVLQERYKGGERVAYYINELAEQNPDLPIDKIGTWAKKAYGMSATSFLRNHGILSTYVYDWEAEKRRYEEEKAEKEKARLERREQELKAPIESWSYEPSSYYVKEVSVAGDEANDWVFNEKEVDGDPVLYLVDYQGEKQHIVLPVSISGKRVAGIDSGSPYLFSKCKADIVEIPGIFGFVPGSMFFSNNCLKHIVIGEGIKEIGKDAFFSAKNLEIVEVSQSVEMIHGSMAFHSTKWFDAQEDYTFAGRVLVDYSGDSAVLNVPKGIKTIAEVVTHSDVIKVVLSDTVETLCNSAFAGRGCQNIQEFVFSSSLKKIGKSAFGSNKWIDSFGERPVIINGILYQWKSTATTLSIPDGVTSICDSAFDDRDKLKKIVFPETVEEIGDSAFSGCSNITEIVFPKALQRIGRAGFRSCAKLKSISFGDSLISIGPDAFEDCYELKAVSLPPSVKNIGSCAFKGCSLLGSVELPESIQEVGDGVFTRCPWLDNVVIPSGITTIGREFFRGCTRLKNLFLPSSIRRVCAGAFEDCESLEAITVPVEIDERAFSRCKNLIEVHLLEGINAIPQVAFRECESLKSIELPNSITEISDNAFVNCTNLQEITLPNSLLKIGHNAFRNCKSLEAVIIPNAVESIMDRAFMDCSSLKTVVFEGTVNHLGIDAFTNTPYLKSAFGEYAIIGGVLTKYLGNDIEVSIPNTVTAIAENAFAEARFIKTLRIPESVQEIGSWLFGKPSTRDSEKLALTTLELGDGVIEIDESAFMGAEQLTGVVFGRKLKTIGKQAFGSCKALKQVDLRNTCVETIKSYAFSSCYELSELLLPETLKCIEYNAFTSTGLKTVRLPKSTQTVGREAFSGIKELFVYDTIEPDAIDANEWTPDQGSIYKNSTLSLAMFKSFGGEYRLEGYARQGCHITVLSAKSDEIRYRVFIDSEENDVYKRLLASAWGKFASFRFGDYDDFFMKTRSLQGRAEMAFCRIQYPEGLTAEHKAIYDAYFERCMYIERSAKRIAELIAKEDNTERLDILYSYRAIDEHNLSWIKEVFADKKATRCLSRLSEHLSK